jgi:hypothetical protein
MTRNLDDLRYTNLDGQPVVAVAIDGSEDVIFIIEERDRIIGRAKVGEPLPRRRIYRPIAYASNPRLDAFCGSAGFEEYASGDETESREQALQWIRDFIAAETDQGEIRD